MLYGRFALTMSYHKKVNAVALIKAKNAIDFFNYFCYTIIILYKNIFTKERDKHGSYYRDQKRNKRIQSPQPP